MEDKADVRGTEFLFRYTGGFPVRYEITRDNEPAGEICGPTIRRPSTVAEFAGIGWEISTATRWLDVRHTVRFESSSVVIAESAGRRVRIDEARWYHRSKPSLTGAGWTTSGEEVVWFARSGWFVQDEQLGGHVREGRVRSRTTAEELDVPILIVLGLVLAVEGVLFRVPSRSD